MLQRILRVGIVAGYDKEGEEVFSINFRGDEYETIEIINQIDPDSLLEWVLHSGLQDKIIRGINEKA